MSWCLTASALSRTLSSSSTWCSSSYASSSAASSAKKKLTVICFRSHFISSACVTTRMLLLDKSFLCILCQVYHFSFLYWYIDWYFHGFVLTQTISLSCRIFLFVLSLQSRLDVSGFPAPIALSYIGLPYWHFQRRSCWHKFWSSAFSWAATSIWPLSASTICAEEDASVSSSCWLSVLLQSHSDFRSSTDFLSLLSFRSRRYCLIPVILLFLFLFLFLVILLFFLYFDVF